MKRSLVLRAVSLALLAPPLGQSASAAQGEGERIALETIYVTATKRTESVREVPASIDAFSGEDLERQGFSSLEDILRFSPGVTFMSGNTPDSNQVNIRGAGSDRGDFNRPFGLFYEDVPLVNPSFVGGQPDIDPFDMATVEVLKGPQGTLFGGSALVGAVRYSPNRPSFEGFDGSASYGIGSTSGSDDLNREYTAMLNAPLGDQVAMRFAGSVRDLAGVIDDTFHGVDDVDSSKGTNWRALLAWRPSERIDVQLLYQNRETDSDANVGTEIDNDRSRLENAFLREGLDAATSELELSGIKLEWMMREGLTLSLISNYLRKEGTRWINELTAFDENGFEVHDNFFQHTKTGQHTHELRLVQDTPTQGGWLLRDWTYVAGLFYMDSDQKMDIQVFANSVDPTAPAPLLLAVVASADAREKAFYFDATRRLNEAFDLNLGVRVFEQRTPLGLAILADFDGSFAFEPFADLAPFSSAEQVLEEDGVNPKAALTWHASDDVSAFVSASKGFRFGGINLDPFQTGEPPPTFKSDQLWNYELGVRTTWLDNRLQADITAFWIDWTDKQTSQQTSAESEYIANTGGRRMRGAEFIVRRVFESGFAWMINGAFVDSETRNDYVSSNAGLIEAGTREPETPRWTGATVLSYSGAFGAWTLDSSLAYSYRSATDSRNFVPLDAYGIADLHFAVANSSWRFAPKITLNVINLANDDSLQFGSSTARADVVGRRIRARTVMPRTVMLTAAFSF